MDAGLLASFESLCQDLYTSSSGDARKRATDSLMPLISQLEAFNQLESILASSRNPHALLFASNALMQLVTNNWPALSQLQRDTLKAFLSTYLTQNCQEMYASPLHEQALQFMIRLLCRIVKLSWLEGPAYQTIVSDIQPLLRSGSHIHSILALDIYISLTGDMQPTKGPQMARLRRTAMSFRDVSLAEVFKSGVSMLRDIAEGKAASLSKSDESRLVHKLLKVVVGSLSFDFMGTIPDETSDDQSTVMIPYNWSSAKDLSQPALFFDIYLKCVGTGQRPSAVLALQSLVLFASLRRSLYSKEDEKTAMLSAYMRGTSQIMAGSVGLDDPECYHEFCRLLGRVNAANQLTDLAANNQFSLWIDQVFSFTTSAIRRAEHLQNSLHYLLSFWTVLVPPMITMAERGPSQVRVHIEQVLVMFVQVKLMLASCDEDETILVENLDVIAALSRLQVAPVYRILSDALSTVRNEQTLTWIVYMFGAVLVGQVESLGVNPVKARSGSLDDVRPGRSAMEDSSSPALSAEYQTVGSIIKQVVGVMARTDSQQVSESLELAYLYFLDQFKKLFLSEQAKVTSLVVSRAVGSSRLCSAIGVKDEAEIVDLFISKILSNFQKRKDYEPVLKRSLNFLNEMISGSTVMIFLGDESDAPVPLSKLMTNNSKINYLLENYHEIDFGRTDKNYNSIYYSIVFKLIFGRSGPITVRWAYFDQMFAQAATLTRSPEQAKLIVTLARDLKGVCQACNSSEHYNLLFKYLVETPKNPAQCKLAKFSEAADLWWDEPQVVVPVLKFIADLAHNRSSRIDFPNNSPNGLVLFKEATKVLSAYGQRILARPATFQYRDIYEEKYKGIGAALGLLTNTLAGGYANLGVFELYGDTSLTTAMTTALNLCLSIPHSDLSAYLESLKSVYTFLEHCSKTQMSPILHLNSAQLCHILRALEDGLTAFDTTVALNACVSIDNVCTYMREPGEDGTIAQAHLGSPEVRSSLVRLLALCVYLAMSGEFASTWSLSRPMLGLTLLCMNEFMSLQASTIQQQATLQRKQQVEKAFKELMTGIEDNLLTKNRELFTKNLYQFGISLRTT